ncbi:MAG: hypothetical protein AAF627_02125 [Myxococcota bacterium]
MASLRKRLGSRRPLADVFSRHTQAGTRLEPLVRLAYVLLAYWYVSRLAELRPLLDPPSPTLRWPVAWMVWVDPGVGGSVVLALGLGGALLAATLPERRGLRALAFLGLLEVLALKYSFGKIHHAMHGWLFLSFLLIFLPEPRSGWAAGRARKDRQQALFVWSAAQVALALTYSLAGLGKLVGTVYQGLRGQPTPLHPSALARHMADRLQQTDADSLLGPWMIEYGNWLWPLMLGTVYLQLFALQAAFRPRLHRWWGMGLIAFHVVSILTLTIDFNPNILLLGLLFVASPMAPPVDPKGIWADLPILGAFAPQSKERRASSILARNRNSKASRA